MQKRFNVTQNIKLPGKKKKKLKEKGGYQKKCKLYNEKKE